MKLQILITAFVSFLVSISAWATPIPSANLGGFDMIYHGEYFTSDKNLNNEGGDTDDLVGGDNYISFRNLFELGYSIRPAFRISAGGTFSYAHSEGIVENRTNSEFDTVVLSAQYFVGTEAFRMVPNLRATIALNEVDINEDEVMTSDGSSRYEFGSWFRYPIWVLDNYAYVGYIYQEDDKADLLNWALGTKWNFSSWSLRGQLNGVTVMAEDAFTDNKFARHGINNIYSAGSLRYNSVNPEYIEFETIIEYNHSPTTRFGGGFGHTITGKNYGFGPSIMLTFTSEFRTDNETIENAYRLDGSGSFQPEVEEYNEDLFSK